MPTDDAKSGALATGQEDHGGVTKTGVRKILWFHKDEAEALRVAAYEKRQSQASIIREAVRRYLGIED